MGVHSRFAVLLAEKAAREKRSIPLTEVAEETGIHRNTLRGWANDTIQRYDAPVIAALCRYLNAQVGDLLVYVPEDSTP